MSRDLMVTRTGSRFDDTRTDDDPIAAYVDSRKRERVVGNRHKHCLELECSYRQRPRGLSRPAAGMTADFCKIATVSGEVRPW